MMKFEASNDATWFRQNAWNERWPLANPALNDSGFTDVNSVTDYMPYSGDILPFGIEHTLRYDNMSVWFRSYIPLLWTSVALYLAFVFLGPRVMRDRKPFDLKGSLAAWNLLCAIFSLLGTCRFLPHIFYTHSVNPPAFFVCRNGTRHCSNDQIFFWASLFVFSKLFEFIDTAFLVLRKKPVSFLHWFHHASVTLYTWYNFAYQSSTGIYFSSMNYLVHSIMYFYYFLAAVGKPPNWGLFVTVIQIAQMFGGIAITLFQFYASYQYPHCDVAWVPLSSAFAMYAVYLGLFVKFFVEKYCTFGRNSRTHKTARSAKHSATNGTSTSNGDAAAVHANGKDKAE